MADMLTILRFLERYTPRQTDIILSEPEEIETPVTDRELRKLVLKCHALDDDDSINLLNSKYDITSLFASDDLPVISPQEAALMDDDIETWMREIDPSYTIPGPKERKKSNGS